MKVKEQISTFWRNYIWVTYLKQFETAARIKGWNHRKKLDNNNSLTKECYWDSANLIIGWNNELEVPRYPRPKENVQEFEHDIARQTCLEFLGVENVPELLSAKAFIDGLKDTENKLILFRPNLLIAAVRQGANSIRSWSGKTTFKQAHGTESMKEYERNAKEKKEFQCWACDEMGHVTNQGKEKTKPSLQNSKN